MAEESPNDDDVKKKVLIGPPNRRRHDDQMEQLMQQIHSLEAELKSYGRPQQGEDSSSDSGQREQLIAEQKRLREEKEASISKRKDLDETLKFINGGITKQCDALSKLETGLAFKTESAFDDAINKLEHQLSTRHFKLIEEKRIVKEIDSFRRSKKKVKEYLQQKQLIDAQRAHQKVTRDERNKYFRLATSLKAKEYEVKTELQRFKTKTDEAWTRYREAGPRREALKKEISECYDKRRQMMAEFKQQHSKYLAQQHQQRAHSFRRKEEERRTLEVMRKKEWEDYEASREPFEDERQLCSVLTKYLQRFLTPDQDLPLGASALSPLQSPTASSSALAAAQEGESPYVIYKKKTDAEDEVFLAATSARKKRSTRRHNRKSSWLGKPIRHTAQIFSQFESLGLRAPSLMSEVPEAIEQLTAKKDTFEAACNEKKSLKLKLSGEVAGCSTTVGSVPTLQSSATITAATTATSTVLTVNTSEHEDADSDCVHSNLKDGQDLPLPAIDIQSARSAQQRNSCSGTNPGSAPETPNSDGSAPRDADVDQESVDSGIGIHRLRTSQVATSTSVTRGLQDLNCNAQSRESSTTEGAVTLPSVQGLEASPSNEFLSLHRGPVTGTECGQQQMVSIREQEGSPFSSSNLIPDNSSL